MIYAIRAGSDGPIKIGKATNPVARMYELQTGSSVPLNLVATQRWPDEVEGEMHRMLAAHRIHGEWFSPVEEVLWVVEKMRDYDAFHEVFWRFKAGSYFPWMSAADEPLAMEYLDDLVSRSAAPVPIVSAHGKWPS